MTLAALLLLWSCGQTSAPPAPESEPELPVSFQPPPAPRTVDEVFSTVYSQTHGGEQRAIAALRALCEAACAPVLTAAEDRTRDPGHRAAVWWALATADVRAASACALLSITPREEWKRHPLDKAAVDRMGICSTPWQYGQQETGPVGG